MKPISSLIFSFAFVFFSALAFAQVPQLFNYQGIARDAAGNPLGNRQISLRLAVLPAADAVGIEYEETHVVSTNAFGLYTLQIGSGKAVFGQMKTVNWESGSKFIRVAIDPQGGENYVNAGTSQLLSVPYAIYAEKAGSLPGGEKDKIRTGAVNSNAAHVAADVNLLTKFTALNTIGKSQLFDNGTSIGLGTTTPSASVRFHIKGNGNIEHIRMENNAPGGFGKFSMYNDNPNNYGTFTKYGSTVAGGYPGVASQYPLANMLAFGNNNGPFILSNSGNIGIATYNGTTNLKFNAHVSTGYLGLGGPFVPAANVHFNNNATGDTLKITNNTSGHLAADGLDIRMSGIAAQIVNRENNTLSLGTNNATVLTLSSGGNVGIGTVSPGAKLDISGNIRIADGTQGAGKVLTSNAGGTASWQNALPNGVNAGDVLVWNGNAWTVTPKCNLYNYYYRDADNDGFGDKFSPVTGCSPLPGFISDSTDCNDNNNLINPNKKWFADSDNDNFGNVAVFVLACLQPAGFVADSTDCDDNNNNITNGNTYFADADGDGFGNAAITQFACVQPAGFVLNGNDCNDNNNQITLGNTYFADADADGFGNPLQSQFSCIPMPGFVLNNLDCDDANLNIHPGANEVCNGLDDDCDNTVDEGFNLATDINNCGQCGFVCPPVANGTAACVNGNCGIGSCFGGYASCDNNLNNGCETDLYNDVNNCGQCGFQCNLPNAVAGCGGGTCYIVQCNPGFANCDGAAFNGCEVNLVQQNKCFISGQCINAGTTNPNNQCQVCNPAQSTTNWSNKTNGTSCSGGTCVNGVCTQ